MRRLEEHKATGGHTTRLAAIIEDGVGTMTKLYLAYGSNLNIKQMAFRCPTAKVVGSSTLDGYELLFRGGNGSAVATVEKKTGGKVPVLIWELQRSDETKLDRYEGYPRLYRKEYLQIELDGEQVEVMAYIMNEGRPLGMPNRHYYEAILDGYLAAGFDVGILDKAARDSDPDRI